MDKKSQSFAEALEKKIEQHNKRTQENFDLYAQECNKQGKKIGEPIDIMEMLKGKK